MCCVAKMASVGAVGHHFTKFPWAENVHETAVELQNGCVVMMAFVGAVGQHFLTFTWVANVQETAVEELKCGCVGKRRGPTTCTSLASSC